MIRQFKEEVHFTKSDKNKLSDRYLNYLRNQNQSKAFQLGILSGLTAVFTFLKIKRNSPKYNVPAKFFYSVNLFLATHVFVYELWSKMYTNKENVFYLDKKILKLD